MTEAYSYIRHAYYGCESGCCGHQIVHVDANGDESEGYFHFGHPAYWDMKAKAYVRDGAREAVILEFIQDVVDTAVLNGHPRVEINRAESEFRDD